MRRILGLLVASALVPSAPAALAADPDPLWDAYPVEERAPQAAPPGGSGPDPADQSAVEPAATAASTRSGEDTGTGGDAVVPWLLAGSGAALAGAAAVVVAARRRRPLARSAASNGAVSSGPAAAPVTAPSAAPAETASNGTLPPVTASPPVPPASPPDDAAPVTVVNGVAPARRFARAARAPAPATAPVGAPAQHRRVRVDCVIDWQPGRGGGRFRAVATSETGETRVVAQSSAFWWPADRPPILTDTTLDAHAGLVDELLERGWRPTGGGFPWYARRFRRWEGGEEE